MTENVREEARERQDSGRGAAEQDAASESGKGSGPMRAQVPAQGAKTGVPLRPAPAPAKSGKTTGMQKAAGLVRAVAPLVQKVLPLLEGNVAMAVTNLLASRPASPRVDLEPLENAMTRMRKDHIDLRLSVADQNAAIKRVADQVETVKDAVDRAGAETKALDRDVQQLKSRVNVFAWIGLILLLLSVVMNIVLFEQMRQLIH